MAGTRARIDEAATLTVAPEEFVVTGDRYSDGADPLALYLAQISEFPLLSAREEADLARRIIELRDRLADGSQPHMRAQLEELKHQMVQSNLRLVVSIAKRYQHQGLGLLDLIDEGNIGLIEAVERFIPSKGFRFSTYGTWWIRQAIVKALADKGRVIRVPIHMLTHIRRCFAVSRTLTDELGRDPLPEEIADRLGCDVQQVHEVRRLMHDTASLDVSVDADNTTRLSDLIEDRDSAGPSEVAYQNSMRAHVRSALGVLTDREKQIIKLRFGIGAEGPYTLEETGRRLGITRERVRQLQEKAIRKLRQLASIRAYQDL
ncbi:MAG: RNA polymerase sigma factor RpoD/SigA [Spirochaetaceae bacterium]|nr:MAG: RNA polymerase sigma factor RpoD/SigA [Spirochaetaceae bacterium]